MRASTLALSCLAAAAALSPRAGIAKGDPPASQVAQGLKYGFIDMARALNDVEDGKVAKAKLKADFEGKQKKLDKMQNDLREKKEAYDKRVGMMKPEARQAKEAELQQLLMEVQQTYMQLQQELVESEGQITQDIRKKLQAVLERMGDRDDYFMILNTGDAVLYHKRHMDVTDDVIREYNKQYASK